MVLGGGALSFERVTPVPSPRDLQMRAFVPLSPLVQRESERERKREGDREKQRQRARESERGRETESYRDRETERQRDRERHTHTRTHTHTQREREKKGQQEACRNLTYKKSQPPRILPYSYAQGLCPCLRSYTMCTGAPRS